MTHTPTPWTVARTSTEGESLLQIGPFETLASRSVQLKTEDAAYIVLCVNSHEALLEALRACMAADGWTVYPDPADFDENLTPQEVEAWTLARHAVAVIEGEKP